MSSGVHIRRFVRKGNIMRARGRTMRSSRRKKRVAMLRRLSYDNVIGHCANNGSTKERSIIFAHHVGAGGEEGQRGGGGGCSASDVAVVLIRAQNYNVSLASSRKRTRGCV